METQSELTTKLYYRGKHILGWVRFFIVLIKLKILIKAFNLISKLKISKPEINWTKSGLPNS